MFSRIHIATLQDLGVYVGQNLTSPVRYCGGLGFFSARAERQCLESLGFSPECLSIWLDNMHNTKKVCFWVSKSKPQLPTHPARNFVFYS